MKPVAVRKPIFSGRKSTVREQNSTRHMLLVGALLVHLPNLRLLLYMRVQRVEDSHANLNFPMWLYAFHDLLACQ
jgi:hypothetical protein